MDKEIADNYGMEEYHPFWVAGHIFKPAVAPDRFPKGNPYTPDQDETTEDEDNVSDA